MVAGGCEHLAGGWQGLMLCEEAVQTESEPSFLHAGWHDEQLMMRLECKRTMGTSKCQSGHERATPHPQTHHELL